MIYNIWFNEKIFPFTQEQRVEYKAVLGDKYLSDCNQELGIGTIVGDRHLVRCLTANFDAIYEFLTLAGKEPIICAVKNQDGSLVAGYPYNPAEYEKYMQPTQGVDIDGNPTIGIKTPDTSNGWADFYEFPEEVV